MKTAYYRRLENPLGLAVMDLVPYGGGYLITRINVPSAHRGRGIARAMIEECLADADRARRWLYLQVSPSDGLGYDALVAWYERCGFSQDELGLWYRRPVRR